LSQIAPSGRSVLIGLLLVLLAAGAYVAARNTSLFAVRSITVRGASPRVRATVRAALAPELGRSLLRVDDAELARRLAGVTGVLSFKYDRAFPHTLEIVVRPERPVLVVRQRASAYLISATGRVLRPLIHVRRSRLPRLYVSHDVHVTVGERLPATAAAAAAVLAPLSGQPLPLPVRFVSSGPDGVTLRLAGGLEIRMGDGGDVRLKLAIASRILRSTGAATAGGGYLDVSVPERPVLSTKSQVAG